ncbi:universal stress protein [Rhizobium leguminosarum]|uniref:universal stress protein n=2 Tax=Rhizobium leguminosarum TaxID=384 RepID=UPI0021BBB7D0|nr:universal stress protein [Rhizobium leguminosarum]
MSVNFARGAPGDFARFIRNELVKPSPRRPASGFDSDQSSCGPDLLASLREEETFMFLNILIPTDGSALARSAVEKAVAFARDANATVTFVTVIEPFHVFSVDSEHLSNTREEYRRLADAQASQFLTDAENKARDQGVVSHTVKLESDEVHSAIIDTALNHDCDLIAMASHGRGGVGSLLLGSVTAKILSHSRIPVLVYR